MPTLETWQGREPRTNEEWWCNVHGKMGSDAREQQRFSPYGPLFCKLCLEHHHYRLLRVIDVSDPSMKLRSAVLKARSRNVS